MEAIRDCRKVALMDLNQSWQWHSPVEMVECKIRSRTIHEAWSEALAPKRQASCRAEEPSDYC